MFLAALASALPLIARDVPPEQLEKRAPKMFSASLSTFAIDLYRVCDDQPGNLTIAPFSVARALAMARSGAAGATAAELDHALHTEEMDIGIEFKALVPLLAPPERKRPKTSGETAYTLDLASAVFVQQNLPVKPNFEEIMHGSFGCDPTRVDFQKPEAACTTINTWASDHTRGRIPQIVRPSDLAEATRAVLADAVFFSAPWRDAFNAKSTNSAPFTTADGRKIDVPTMHRHASFEYGETKLAQVLEIAHETGATSVLIVLPKPGTKPSDLADQEDFAAWTGCLKSASVDVSLPKFTSEKGRDLREPLMKLGVDALFDAQHCDLSGIMAEPLFIGAVLHRARLTIDEDGTEAAAVTALVARAGAAAKPQDPATFVADRPFLFALRHRATNTILFCGRVDDPTAR